MPSLEIGSGNNPQPGYIHTDAYVDDTNRHFIDVVCDARKLPFPDGEFDSVLMFGVFEHFGYFEIQEALLEISRVLRRGGIFKFDAPDFDWFIHAYLTGEDRNTGLKLDPHRDEKWIMHSLFGGQDGPGMYHKWGWSEQRLTKFLSDPKWDFSTIHMTGRQWRDPEENHLVMECIK
jgi:predicted SAM-dependent methyltransferase